MPLDSLSRPTTVDCLKFENAGGGKCKLYDKGGVCQLIEIRICTEWEKRNGAEGALRRVELARTDASRGPATSPNPHATEHANDPQRGPQRRQLALLSDAPPEAATGAPSSSKPQGATIHELGAFANTDELGRHYGPRGVANDPTPRGLAPKAPSVIEIVGAADVAALAARGYEMCLEGWNGGPDVWLVPTLTGASRIELTYENAMTLANLTAAFPGARVKVIVNDVTRSTTSTHDALAL